MNAEGENTRTIIKAKKANRRTQKKRVGVKAAKGVTQRASKPKTVPKTEKRQPRTAHEYTEIGLQDLAILLFGKETVHEVKKKMDVREIWTVSTNTTQCNNVIGKVTAETPCWICGLKIDASDPGMSPECEHVLPVAQAVIYLSLYSAKKKNNTTPERNARKMEYGWAHAVCNQDKSDICCMVNAGDKAAVSDRNIKFILKKIYTSNRADSAKIKSELKVLYPTLDSFIAGRLDPMRKRYQDIVDHLNPSSGENRFKLTILSGLVTAMDYSNIREDVHELLIPEFLAEKEKQKRALKELLTRQIQQDIVSTLGKEKLELVVDAARLIDSVMDVFNIQKLHEVKQHYLADIKDSAVNKEWEDNLDIAYLVKIYHELYMRLGLMFIDSLTKSYIKVKIEYNCYMCIGFYLVINYFTLVEKNIDRNTKLKRPTKIAYKKIVIKIVDYYKKYMNKNFPGIYSFIDEYYHSKHNKTDNITNNSQKN